MSGSRGEANFVWKCKNCKVCLYSHSSTEIGILIYTQTERTLCIHQGGTQTLRTQRYHQGPKDHRIRLQRS